jgi:hypothetical protein
MRVLHVMAGAAQGGAETMMLDGVLALAEAGVDQYVVTRSDNPHRIAALNEARVPVATARFNRFWRIATERQIRKGAETLKPDVIHYWMGRAGEFAPARWRNRSLGWYGGYYKLSRFKNCDWHAGVTPDIARHIVSQGAPEARVSTLYTFANIETEAPVARASLNTPEDAPLILFLGRMHHKKGVDTLLDALSGMPGAYAWLAGTGPLENEMRAKATALGLDDRVRFLGWRTDRSALLAACDLVAFPSRYEPFGTVTIEAWAAERPLVVTDAAGPAATVTDGEDALLVPRDDVAALREAMVRVIQDRVLARKLVVNAKRVYEARFTKTAFVRAAMALYEKISTHTSEKAAE